MATANSPHPSAPRDEGVTLVDPRVPRFGQSVTTLGLVAGLVLQLPILVYAVAVILLTAVLSRWRFHPYSLVWRNVIARAVDEPAEPEPAAPHRFATLLGGVGTTIASVALLLGFSTVGYAFAGAVAAAAGLAAVTGYCLGCNMYRSVSLFRRLDIV